MSYPTPTPPPAAPQPLTVDDEKLWAMLANASGFLLGFLGPLLIMLIMGPRSEFVKRNSVEALNFQLTLLIGYIVSIILMFVIVGIFTFFAILIVSIIFMVLASIATYNHQDYRYPVNIRMIK